jgi:two-component system cell cycle sensor histidine kinase PleC
MTQHNDVRLTWEQLRELATATRRDAPLLPVSAIGLGVLAAVMDNPFAAMAWLAVMAASSTFLVVVCLKLLKATFDPQRVAGWKKLVLAASCLQASTTAGFPVVFWQTGHNDWNLLLLLIALASTTMAVSLTAPLLPALAGVLAIFSVASIFLCVNEGTGLFLAVAGLAPIFFATVAGSGYNSHLRLKGMLTLGFERDALIEDLRQASRSKSEFLANMSHELRTPLNAILGFAEMMKDEVLGAHAVVRYRAYSADIHGSGQHLLTLINDILDLAKIEAGRMTLSEEVVPLDDLVADCMRIAGVRAANSGIMTRSEVEPGLAVFADARAVKQVLLNVLSNALKFSPGGSTVLVHARRVAGGGLAISVTDDGPGIRADDQERIFESFGQGRHDVALKDRGTGLGLPIVKGLVDAHGGSVRLDSALGRGTTVTITLPAERLRNLPPGNSLAAA